MKERAFKLANMIEEKWRQRSRCNWLKQGDKNTKNFHAYASSRNRHNLVLSITHGEVLISDPKKKITEAFFLSLKEHLGTSNLVRPFNPSALYQPKSDLGCLQNSFTMEEVKISVRQLAKNKASGPDGLPNEFFQLYWPELKHEIMLGFYQGPINLSQVNLANIIMISKKEVSKMVNDFRAISVINIIPKLISKILSNRLRLKMPNLISARQTAFISGRQISENSVATREVLQHIKESGRAGIFLKLDFAKAFDSIEWDFLIKVMVARGFPQRWINWIIMLLETSSSRVLINGDASEIFKHKRGLRQGDPLSLMLFNIAADVFRQMVIATSKTIQGGITRKVKESILAYQYADDTVLVAKADALSLISLKIVIKLFSSVSSLRVNYQKSSFIPINVNEQNLQWVQAILGCGGTVFPITYLGMP